MIAHHENSSVDVDIDVLRHQHRVLRGLAAVGATLFLAAAMVACTGGIREMTTAGVTDAAGMTRSEVEDLGPEGHFNLAGDRYLRMQELMTDAQYIVGDGPWKWMTSGYDPQSGTTVYDPLPGASLNNAYHMSMVRHIQPERAIGAVADARPVYDYFVSKGWEVSPTENDFSELELEATRDFRVEAITEDGYRMQYVIQQNGWYYFEVLTDTFWGNADAILSDQSDRFSSGSRFPQNLSQELSPEPGWSVPGVYTEYPEWGGPIYRNRDGG